MRLLWSRTLYPARAGVREPARGDQRQGEVWHGRTAVLGCIIEGVIQTQAAEAARDN